MSSTSLLLKRDGLGCVRTPVVRREELPAEFAHSGLTAACFAALAGFHYQTFIGWVCKQRLSQGAYSSLEAPARFMEVARIPAAEPVLPLTLEL